MDITIYGIYDPTNNNILKYIGKTTTKLNRRLSNHIYRAKSGRSKSLLSKWILELCDFGYNPVIMTIFVYNDDNINWQECEKFWISKFLQSGIKLLNQTVGGNGAHTRIFLNENIYEMLGKVPDNQIAKVAGVSRKCISYHRNKAKISPAPKESYRYNPHTKGKPSPRRIEFTKKIKNLIGTIPDTKVAKLSGVHVKTILRYRKRNGIKAYVQSGEYHPKAKLTKQNIKSIFNMYKSGEKIKIIAKINKVSYHTIWDVLSGRSWKG